MNPEEREVRVDEMKQHVIRYSVPNDYLAWKALAVTGIVETFVIALIYFQYHMLGWTLHMLNFVRLFVQFHDMAHFSFFTSMRMNKIIGTIFGVFLHFPFQAWRDGHNHHHKHFGNLDRLDLSQTILFTKKQYQEMPTWKKIMVRIFREPIVFFLFSAPFVWFVGLIVTVAKRYGILSWPYFQKILSIVLFVFILPYFGVSRLGLCLAIYGTNLFGTALFHLQHSVNLPYRSRGAKWDFTRAALEGSTFVQIPYFLKMFTNGIEYHHIHHLNTNIASYMIQECHQAYGKSDKNLNMNWETLGVHQVDLPLCAKSMKNVMLDEEKGIIVPFSYKWN